MHPLIFLSFVISVYGRPDGAPSKACSTLMPLHGGNSPIPPQTTKAPYSVTAQEIGNSKYLVKISSSGEPFKGFVLQARSSTNPENFIDGWFTSSDVSKTINCFDSQNNTLTHVNPDPKHEVITEWMPRYNIPEDIIFRATVAKEYDEFWTEIDSQPFSPKTKLNDHSIAGNCNITEGCSGLPDGCVSRGNCKILLRYSKTPDGIHFAIHSYIESSHYMAMALSDDKIMGNDSVTECIRDGTNLILRHSWNEGKTNTRTREVPNEFYRSSFSDGLSTCVWSEPFHFERNGRSYDLMKMQYHLLFATGEVKRSSLQYHTNKTFTAERINFTAFGVNTTEDSTIFLVPDIPHSNNDTVEDSVTSLEVLTTSPNSSSGFGFSFIMLVMLGMLHATKEILRVLA